MHDAGLYVKSLGVSRDTCGTSEFWVCWIVNRPPGLPDAIEAVRTERLARKVIYRAPDARSCGRELLEALAESLFSGWQETIRMA